MRFAMLHDDQNMYLHQIQVCNVMNHLLADWFGSWLVMLNRDCFLNPYGKIERNKKALATPWQPLTRS